LQNNGARWYDAITGRWLSQDPIGYRATDANLYRYCRNAPLTRSDPSGKEPVTIAITTAVVANIVYHGILTIFAGYYFGRCWSEAQALMERARNNFGGDALAYQAWLRAAKPGQECADLASMAMKQGTYTFIACIGGIVVKYGITYVHS
jgi:uncharacterized protein RhaS with RHS repeats